MKKFDWKYIPIFVMVALGLSMAPIFRAQDLGSVTRITPVPGDAEYLVDGQAYTQASSAVWPAWTKHTLWVSSPVQTRHMRTRYVFRGWEQGGIVLPTNPVTVTASASITEYRAVFGVEHALGMVYFNCPADGSPCQSPGAISVDGVLYNSNAELYLPANSVAVLQAFPSPGYVFMGWTPGANQKIAGYQNTVSMTGPVYVYPRFQLARKVSVATDPPDLRLLIDRTLVPAPATFDWAVDSVHMVGANSPQRDQFGKLWAFQSWSDGGEANHAYTVALSSMPTGLTAKFVGAAMVSVLTKPVGLKIKVDGQYNALNPYYFGWGPGEKHHLEAPEQQTDANGRVWVFSGWSNGGTATQDIVVPAEAEADGLRLLATYTPLTKLTVNSSLAGLSVKVDGVACKTPCEVQRDPGTQVRVSAPASVSQGDGARADFDGWPGTTGDLVITVGESAATFSANYHLLNRLSAACDPMNGAEWSVLPASADGFYRADTSVSLSLTMKPGYRFRRWDGDLSGTIPSGVVAMSAPRVVKAMLDRVPYVAPAGVSNAAGVTPQTGVAAGGIISIFGANLAAETAVAPDGVLPQTLGGLTVRVGERWLPLFFVSPAQINALLPDDLATGNQVLTISGTGTPDVRAAFTVVRNAPGLFQVAVNDQAMAMAVHEDGSPVTTDAPARRGELLTLYGTGFGPADRVRPEGFPIPETPVYSIVDGVTVQVGEAIAPAERAFAVVGRYGIDAVQFRLDGVAAGTATLRVSVNGTESNTLLLPVQ